MKNLSKKAKLFAAVLVIAVMLPVMLFVTACGGSSAYKFSNLRIYTRASNAAATAPWHITNTNLNQMQPNNIGVAINNLFNTHVRNAITPELLTAVAGMQPITVQVNGNSVTLPIGELIVPLAQVILNPTSAQLDTVEDLQNEAKARAVVELALTGRTLSVQLSNFIRLSEVSGLGAVGTTIVVTDTNAPAVSEGILTLAVEQMAEYLDESEETIEAAIFAMFNGGIGTNLDPWAMLTSVAPMFGLTVPQLNAEITNVLNLLTGFTMQLGNGNAPGATGNVTLGGAAMGMLMELLGDADDGEASIMAVMVETFLNMMQYEIAETGTAGVYGVELFMAAAGEPRQDLQTLIGSVMNVVRGTDVLEEAIFDALGLEDLQIRALYNRNTNTLSLVVELTLGVFPIYETGTNNRVIELPMNRSVRVSIDFAR